MNMAKPKTITLVFTRNTLPREGAEYKAGQIVELAEDSANRWLRREAAKPAPASDPAKKIETGKAKK